MGGAAGGVVLGDLAETRGAGAKRLRILLFLKNMFKAFHNSILFFFKKKRASNKTSVWIFTKRLKDEKALGQIAALQ